MKKQLQEKIFEITKTLYPELDLSLDEIEITYPPEHFGDYTTNYPLKLARLCRENPMKLAEKIKQSWESDSATTQTFEKIEVATPGFLNFFLAANFLQNQVAKINQLQESFGNGKLEKKIKVNDEFISANPTGPLHLGNGRGGFLGDALGNILTKAGYEVTKEYYVNDFGEQVVKLGHSILADDEAVYGGEYIQQLKEKVNVNNQDAKAIGQEGAKIVLDDYIKKTVQEKLGIQFNVWFSEKSLYEKGLVDQAIELLKTRGFAYEKDGAWWFRSTEFGDDKDRVLIKGDGNKTYFASDCGYILDRMQRGFEIIVEIWGADHHGYVKRFEAAAKGLGFDGQLRFLIVQLVKLVKDGQEFRMSKRKGNVVYIDDLIEMVGSDVARFIFLMYSADSHMNFDLDVAQSQSEKNPVFYVQYAHARICSILKKAQEELVDENVSEEKNNLKLLAHKKELILMKHLNKFPALIEEIAQNLEVHRLPYYVIELADKFHSFYHDCKVIDKDNPAMSRARLELVQAAKVVLAEALRLLGVKAPEKM